MATFIRMGQSGNDYSFVFVVVGGLSEAHRIMYSFDWVTWTSIPSPYDANWYDVAWSPDLGILVGVATVSVGNFIMTSRPVGVWGAINIGRTHAQVMSQLSWKF